MDYVIEMLNITKEFPGIKANDDVTLKLKKGEVHALLGENGAGKSTLMSVLFGLYQAEEGIIKVRGKEVKIKNPNDANDLHIGMVHQHFKLVHNFTVAENIVLGIEDTKNGFLKMDDAIKKIEELSDRYKLKIDPNAIIEDITVGMQQRVEILKMLYRDAEILIFDEPTAVLTPQEIDELMRIIKNLIKEGKSVILITHKLKEIKAVADRCSVLRKGKYIGTVEVDKTTTTQMAEMMVGRPVSFDVDKKPMKLGETVLKVENLTVENPHTHKNYVNNVSFEVKRGEILCLAGIEGNGQTQLVEAITGLRPHQKGLVILNGEDISKLSIRKKTLSGIGHIPEDRHKHGLVLDYNLGENLILQTYFEERFQNKGFLKFDEISTFSNYLIERFDIRSGQGDKTPARAMSGGNQQKAIVAREIDREPDLMIAVQPTRGLDVGAIEYIHKQLIMLREQNKAVLLISLELDEVMSVSDRIVVMYEGELVANVLPKETTENELGLYMSGSKRGDN
ncbi:Xylose import ATP-binding protein XylG [Candidatus Izimaplasma bacterium HR1]|jgi:simple sugar transport system ATP-binding protein|uniref:ABC transporter ATP-binding protein n=1 Tax=Candidatus Izimoplasma sp. HR1 TaxID=1541959 RepID=UPI0004F78B76|nr:Xylose import ATP-binding protein XylG [Candidatus Izimaplasma bacterium HR1]